MDHAKVTRRSTLLAVRVAGAIGLASAVAPVVATAQQPPLPASSRDSAALGEIIVTARRVEERLQDTPIAVSAFQSADIERESIRNVGDVASFTPNFLSNPGPTGGNDGYYFIRGVGQTDLNPATDPGVGTYIDGVYLGRVMGASPSSSDITRIEVLRGPQGTLFGRNTVGGAVSITTRDPSKLLDGDIGVAGGSRRLKQVHGLLDLPLGENSGLLLSGNYRDQDGWGHRASDGKLFDTNTEKSGRLKYKWDPNDSFSLTLAGDAAKLTGTSQHQILIGFNPNAVSPLGVPLPPGMANYVNTTDVYANNSSIDPKKDYDIKGASLTLDWKLRGGDLKSITAYRKMAQLITTDYDGSPYSFYEGGFNTQQHQWSEELQMSGDIGRAKWLVGGFYYKEQNDHTNIVSLGGNNGCLPFPAPPPPGGFPYPVCNFAGGQMYATPGVERKITNNQAFTLVTKATAFFGQTTIKLAEHWSTTLGLRWTKETKDQNYNFFIDNTDGVANLAGLPPAFVLANPSNPHGYLYTLSPNNPFNTAPTSYNKDWTQFTPKAGLEWKPSDSMLYYLSYSKGFKSGGFNGRPAPNANGQFGTIEPYDPEKMDTYELGAKTQFADNKVRLNIAVFQSNYKGIQLLALDLTSGFFNTLNAAESRIRGAEVELTARPLPAFEVQAGFGYTDDSYQSLTPGTLLSGIHYNMHLPLTPKMNGSLGAQYTWDVPGGSVALRGDYSFRTEYWYEAANSPLNRQGGYSLVNARATYTFGDGRWSVAAYGLNLGNKVYLTNAQDVTGPLGVAFASVSPPREWGGEVRYRFGR